MSDRNPTLINDRYEVIDRIGRGGMAEVFRARDLLLDREVAVKVLFPENASDPNFVERFRREAQSAAGLNHPNIVGVYDWGQHGSTYFMAMEFVPGKLAFRYRGNWKLQLDNGTDFYHLTSTHPSFMKIVERRKQGQSSTPLRNIDFNLYGSLSVVSGGFTFPYGHAVLWSGNPAPETRPIFPGIEEVRSRVGDAIECVRGRGIWVAQVGGAVERGGLFGDRHEEADNSLRVFVPAHRLAGGLAGGEDPGRVGNGGRGLHAQRGPTTAPGTAPLRPTGGEPIPAPPHPKRGTGCRSARLRDWR